MRVHRALAPRGWLIFGRHTRAPNALGEALTNLRIVRDGGHPWTPEEVEEQLGALGFGRIETFSPSPSILFVLGQRPEVSDSI